MPIPGVVCNFNSTSILEMKKALTLILVILFVLTTHFCSAQQSEEAIIRNIENNERVAILKGDTTILLNLLSPDVVVLLSLWVRK